MDESYYSIIIQCIYYIFSWVHTLSIFLPTLVLRTVANKLSSQILTVLLGCCDANQN